MSPTDTSPQDVNAEVKDDGKVEEVTKPGDKAASGPQDTLTWPVLITCIFVGLACFYLFIVGLALMGNSFKAMAGSGASQLFGSVKDPIAGLMVGILATVMVQSSSTSTSIVVSMVAADAIEVVNAIPIIMGANIGTSVTNTIVSMTQSGNRLDLERSFAGATVHDMFNCLTVALLLPIEAIIGAAEGTGGPLYWLTHAITTGMMGGEGGEALFKSPLKEAASPFASVFLKANKYVIYGQTLPRPTPQEPASRCLGVCESESGADFENCTSDESRRLEDVGEEYSRALLNKRQLSEEEEPKVWENQQCKEYSCVSKALSKNFKKANGDAYENLLPCADALPGGADLCDGDPCYMHAVAFYDAEITEGRLISGGFLKDAGDEAGGIVGVIFSLIFMTLGLIGLCKSLQKIFMGKAKAFIEYSTKLNDYVAILVGVAITIVVQSSSVTTSALTPLVGIGVLPVKKMLPLTLGANIGTTCTALIAACVDLKFNGVQIALAHLFFNIIGILIWFPVPATRRIPLAAARLLGNYASYYRWVPAAYIAVTFVAIPGIFIGVSQTFYASIGGGVVLLLFVLLCLGVFEFWWWKGIGPKGPGCYLALSAEQREQGEKELAEDCARIMGRTPDEYRFYSNYLSWSGNDCFGETK